MNRSSFRIHCIDRLARWPGWILWLMLSSSVLATPTGNVRGLVTDAQGAAFPSVAVTLRHPATGQERRAVADAQGHFQFSQLAPATWILTAEAKGCRRLRLPVIVHVAQTTAVHFGMQLGEIHEVVDVAAQTSRLDHQPTRSTVVSGMTLNALPLNARQFLELALLAPGVAPGAPGTQGNGFNAAGARSQSNVYLLDGLSHQDTQQNDSLNQFRLTDAVAEFAVQTSVTSAEFGRGSGAQINIVTKTGADEFHGSAFEYFRDTRLNAADFFTNKLGGQKSELKRNQFGATLGGPLQTGRTFFFASYEGFRQRAPAVRATRVPTLVERASVTDAIAKRLLDFWPLPNATGTTNYLANVPNSDDDDTGLLRLDHRLGQTLQLSGRWAEYRGTSVVGGVTPLTGGNAGDPRTRSLMLSATYVPSTRWLLEWRLGYARNQQERRVQDFTVNAAKIFTDAAGRPLPGVVDAARDPLNAGLPTITLAGGYAALGTNANFPQGRLSATTEFFDNLTVQAPFGFARHTWRAGLHMRREDLRRYLNRAVRGSFNFASFADFARGQVNTSSIRTGSTLSYWRRYPWAAYWQEEIKLRANLTLHLGLRYEAPSAVRELRGRATNFVPGVGPVVVGSNQLLQIDPTLRGLAALSLRAAAMTLPDAGVYADRNNFAPVVGWVYTPRRWRRLFGDGDTVLRGGWRVAYDDLFNNVPTSMALGPPANLQITQTANVTQPGRFSWATGFDQSVPLISNVGRQGPGTPTVGVVNFQGVDPRMRSAYLHHYTLGVQRRLRADWLVEASYQGSAGRRLGMFVDVNQPTVIVRDATRRGPVAPNEQVFPYPQFGNVQLAQSIGNSHHNGLTLSAKYQPRNGAYLAAYYALGKTLDDNSSYFGTNNPFGETGAPVDGRNLRLERGPAAFDIRQRFNLVYVLTLPSARRVRWLTSGWQLAGNVTVQAGYPFTVVMGGADTSGFNQATAGLSPAGGNRPDLVKPGALPQNNRNPDAAFDSSWFAPALAGRVGTSGRNQFYGPGLHNYDAALLKEFAVKEKARLQLRADVFNLFNHTNFANPVSDLNNANFGKITQTLGAATSNSIGVAGGPPGGPRLIQLSLRLQF